jgi:hypothetical protein
MKSLLEHVAKAVYEATHIGKWEEFIKGWDMEDDSIHAPKEFMEIASAAIEAVNSYKHPEYAVCTGCGKTVKYNAACDCFIPTQNSDVEFPHSQQLASGTVIKSSVPVEVKTAYFDSDDEESR